MTASAFADFIPGHVLPGAVRTGNQILAFAHVHDDGSTADGQPVTIVKSDHVAQVIRTSTGHYTATLAAGVDATVCDVSASYLSDSDGDQGLTMPNNTISASIIKFARYDIFSTGDYKNGPFTFSLKGELTTLPDGSSVAQFGSAAGTVTEGNDARLPVRVDTTVAVPNGTTSDTTAYTTTGRFRLEDVLLVVDTALVGAGSCVASVGATAGGQEYLLDVTLNSSTPLGVVAGEALTSLGASMAAANGFQALLASSAPIVLRLVTTGVITAGAVRLIVKGLPNV